MFKSWLVSNIGFAFIPIYAIISLIFMNKITIGGDEAYMRFLVIFAPAIVTLIFAGGIADSGFIGSLVVGLLGIAIIVGGFYLVWGGTFGDMGGDMAISGGAIAAYFIISFIVSVFVAIFAFKYFDDVVDTRWLYRNSEVSIYAEEWKYALNRFGITLGGFMGIPVSILVGLLFSA